MQTNVIKLSSFKQKVTLPELHKREKGGLFLSDLCYIAKTNLSL